MDKLSQVGKSLHRIQENTRQALQRSHKIQPLLARTRDVFDADHSFSMEFICPDIKENVSISLIFSPPPPCDIQSEGCFVGRCDFYYGASTLTLTTAYEYIAGTTFVYVNDFAVTSTETGAREVTIFARESTDRVRVCYVYQVTGCTETVA